MGRRVAPPDDRLREAIHRATSKKAGLLRCARNDVETCAARLRDLAARCARALRRSPSSERRGRRESRVRAAPAVSCAEVEKKRTRAYRSSGGNPAFPARWFTAYSALSSVTGLSCHRRQRNRFHQLDASVGASGPHGFAVRIRCSRRVHRQRPPHPAPTFVTMANAPPWSRMARVINLIWGKREAEYFLRRDWTTQITLIRLRKLDFTRKSAEPRGRLQGSQNSRRVGRQRRAAHFCREPTIRDAKLLKVY